MFVEPVDADETVNTCQPTLLPFTTALPSVHWSPTNVPNHGPEPQRPNHPFIHSSILFTQLPELPYTPQTGQKILSHNSITKARLYLSLRLFTPSPSKPRGSRPKNPGLTDIRPLTLGLTTNHTPVRSVNSSQCLCGFSFIQIIIIQSWISPSTFITSTIMV